MFKDIYAVSYKMRHELYHKIFVVIMAILICFIAISLFMTFVLFPVRSVSNAMAPDVASGSITLVSPLLRSLQRGDVVLLRGKNVSKKPFSVHLLNHVGRFVSAQQWQPVLPESPTGEQQQLRRVVGLPGDTIYLTKYVLYVRPKGDKHFLTEFELTETKYNVTIPVTPALWDTELGVKGSMTEFQLGANDYFVLGDNRLECADSRLWGVIHKDAVVGKAVLLYFPLNKIRLFL